MADQERKRLKKQGWKMTDQIAGWKTQDLENVGENGRAGKW